MRRGKKSDVFFDHLPSFCLTSVACRHLARIIT
jgi:hypothetical protein